jgi:beta-xylosidase
MSNDTSNRLPRRDFLRNVTAGAIGFKPLASGLAGLMATETILAAGDISAKSETRRRDSGDQGDGTYKNPVIMAGDIADLSIVREGQDYYLIHGYYCAPGLLMWHSRDLVNWEPFKKCQARGGGGGDIARFGDRYALLGDGHGVNIRQAPNVWGPWGETLHLGNGDAWDITHLQGSDGKFYALGGSPVPYLYEIAPDGKSIVGNQKLGYDGWPYPEEWDTEGFFIEGWNTAFHNGYYYVLAAQGGTSGPATSHMCVAARSKSPTGPWENSPYNPIIHTYTKDDPFWSKGQGTLIDTPEGEWYILYHAYLKGARNLGRQVCLEPVEWTKDGWFRVPKNIISGQPIPKPKGGEGVPHGFKLSDDFRGPELDIKWGFPAASAEGRYRFVKDGMALKAYGEGISTAVPLVMPVTHRAFEFVAEMSVPPGVEGGAGIYASSKANAMISVKDGQVRGQSLISTTRVPSPVTGERIFFRVVFINDNVRLFFGPDGAKWTKLETVFDVSGFHRNVFGGVESVQPGLYASGNGEIILHSFQLRGLV